MTTQSSKFRSRWWYALPIILGILGGIITWFALQKDDRKLAKHCLILGILLDVLKLIMLASFFGSSNLDLITEFETLIESNDLGFQFKIESP